MRGHEEAGTPNRGSGDTERWEREPRHMREQTDEARTRSLMAARRERKPGEEMRMLTAKIERFTLLNAVQSLLDLGLDALT